MLGIVARVRSLTVSTCPSVSLDTLLKNQLDEAEAKLLTHDYGQRIARRLRQAFNMGTNERLANFMQEIGLSLSKGELETLQARNFSAHGGKPAEIREALGRARSYRTILNRVLLTLVNHGDSYADYSTAGFPQRPLAEPSGPAAG